MSQNSKMSVSVDHIYIVTHCFGNRIMEVSGVASKLDCLDPKGK